MEIKDMSIEDMKIKMKEMEHDEMKIFINSPEFDKWVQDNKKAMGV